MKEEKTKVYATFDTQYETWNWLKCSNNECVFYGTIEELETWLQDNSENYEEY